MNTAHYGTEQLQTCRESGAGVAMRGFYACAADVPMPRRISNRVIIREKIRVQVQFLEELTRIPGSENFVLYGGAALHGVYLHERFSADIDLLVPREIEPDFRALIVAYGLVLEDWADYFPVYVRPGTFGGIVKIEVGVVGCWESDECVAVAPRRFGYFGSRTVTVRAASLAYLLAKKLDCVTRGARCQDFLDLWLGFGHDARNVPETFAAHEKGRPGMIFDPDIALEHLESLRGEWEETLALAVPRVPDYDTVRRDIQQWLRDFSA